MTKEEIQRIYDACELVHTGEEEYTCLGLKFGPRGSWDKKMVGLMNRYREFYAVEDYVFFSELDAQYNPEIQTARILLLLLFMEAEATIPPGYQIGD